MFRKLDPEQIVETANRLERRIEERFPGAGLASLARELTQVTREARALSLWLAAPNKPLRAGVGLAILALFAIVLGAGATLRGETGPHSWADWVQSLEALVNDGVFVGIAVYFLLGLEARHKRARALEALHVLRSLAHIVDMHQLTKDPERLTGAHSGGDTASSPKRDMTPFQLTRYLDYSSELLALLSKIAAIYVQRFNDAEVLRAAGDMESKFSGTAYAPMAALVAAKSSFDANDLKSAKAQLQWAAEHGSDEFKAVAKVRLAGVLLDEKAYDQGLALLKDAPAQYEALFADRRGDLLAAQDKRDEARTAYRRALEKLGASEGGMRQIIQFKLDALGTA